MKSLLFIAATLLLHASGYAQQYSYEVLNSEAVSKSIGKIATDNSGNTIITGEFATTITFGSFTLVSQTPDPYNQAFSAYVAKQSSSGSYVWAKGFTPMPVSGFLYSWAKIFGVATDADGNTYLTGEFIGKIKFDNIILTSAKNGAEYTWDMVTIKISAAGSVLWVRPEGSNSTCVGERGESVVPDGSGNVYATGVVSIKVGNKTLASCYVVKYNASGTKVWEKKYYNNLSASCGPSAGGSDIRYDGSNMYITGQMTGTVTFGNVTLSTGSASQANVFLLKLNSSGNTVWAKNVTGSQNITFRPGDGEGYLDVNNSEMYISGIFYAGNTISFGGCSLSTTVTTTYIAKYSSAGDCLWAQKNGIGNVTGLVNHPNGTLAVFLRPFAIKEVSTADGVTVDSLYPTNSNTALLSGSGLIRTSDGFVFSQSLTGSYDFGGTTISSEGTNDNLLLVSYGSAPPPEFIGNTVSHELTAGSNIYPNPVSHELFVKSSEGDLLGDVVIYDAAGRNIFQKFVSGTKTGIDVSSFSPGIYFVSSDQFHMLKFIKL